METMLIAWTFISLAALGEQVEERPTLRAVWVDVSNVASFSFETMARESVSILEDVGIELTWVRGDVGVLPSDVDLTVILLNSGPSAGLNPRCMGATRPGSSPPTVWVFLPNVLWALGADLKRDPWTAPQARDLGVAMGRVAAHEIAHALAPSLRHSSHGLMSERLNRTDLQQVRLGLDEPSRRAILSALSKRSADLRHGERP